jgi:hypothetical protein
MTGSLRGNRTRLPSGNLAGYFAKLTAPFVLTQPPPLPLVPVVVIIGI